MHFLKKYFLLVNLCFLTFVQTQSIDFAAIKDAALIGSEVLIEAWPSAFPIYSYLNFK